MREAIVEAAIGAFTKSGLKFKMNDIAKSMGISKKTIYTVFDSKEAVMEAIADKYFADFLALQQQVAEDETIDVITKLRLLLCALPERYHNIGLSNLYELQEKYPRIHKRLLNYVSQGWESVAGYLEDGIRAGVLRNISLPVVMAMIEGAVRQFMQSNVLVENGIAYEDAKIEMVQVILDGIRT